VLVPGGPLEIGGEAAADALAWDVTAVSVRATSARMADAVSAAHEAVAGAGRAAAPNAEQVHDPAERLELAFEALLGMEPPDEQPDIGPALVVAVGDLDMGQTLNRLERTFGEMEPAARPRTPRLRLKQQELRVRVGRPIAQAQLGYVVPAPEPSAKDAWAWRLLLYVLAHGYEGRLGKAAIGARGLVYYIDAGYRSDGERAFVSLATGVDPAKLESMEQLMRAEIARLVTEPPDEDELAEARRHVLGRLRSAAVSNDEISAQLALDWLWYGRLLDAGEVEAALARITTRDVAKAAKDFASGAYAVVSH
jgi:predicted Zn-dependent peptidase